MRNFRTLFVPLTKTEVDDDGSVYVEGNATVEEIDHDGEIVSYAASKAAFDEWSDYFQKVTDGKSIGNIRAMHKSVAAGKAVAWWADDATKSIGLRAKIVDQAEAKKCVEGVYTGFSIGAPANKVSREMKKIAGKAVSVITKYSLSEVSLADKPCSPSSVFSMVKVTGTEAEATEAPLEKDVTTALASANSAIGSLKMLLADIAGMPGEPSTWTIHDIASALSMVIGAKVSIESAIVDQALDAAAGAGADQPGDTQKVQITEMPPVLDEATIQTLAKTIVALLPKPEEHEQAIDASPIVDALHKVEKSFAVQVEQLKASHEGLAKTVDAAVAKSLEDATAGLRKSVEEFDERIKKVEAQPAPVGRPVQKSIGSSSSGDADLESQVDQLLQKAQAGGAPKKVVDELRLDIVTAMLSR